MAIQEQELSGPWQPPVRVIGSRRRRRTVQARLRSGVLEVLVPESMPERERERWAEIMRARIERQLQRARPTDDRLEDRAQALNRRIFGGRLRWNSVAFAEQGRRWGSCTYTAGVVRISHRAATLPAWVLDYLLVPPRARRPWARLLGAGHALPARRAGPRVPDGHRPRLRRGRRGGDLRP
jgi:predicted metal-dependent hydrolase